MKIFLCSLIFFLPNFIDFTQIFKFQFHFPLSCYLLNELSVRRFQDNIFDVCNKLGGESPQTQTLFGEPTQYCKINLIANPQLFQLLNQIWSQYNCKWFFIDPLKTGRSRKIKFGLYTYMTYCLILDSVALPSTSPWGTRTLVNQDITHYDPLVAI